MMITDNEEIASQCRGKPKREQSGRQGLSFSGLWWGFSGKKRQIFF